MDFWKKLLGVPGETQPEPGPPPRIPRSPGPRSGPPSPGTPLPDIVTPFLPEDFAPGTFKHRRRGLSSFDQGPLVKIKGIPRPTGRAPVNPDICYRIKIPLGARGTTQTLERMADMAVEASQDTGFVQEIRSTVRGCKARDVMCEGETIYKWTMDDVVVYRNDPMFLEYLQSPGYTLFVDGQGDCFTKGTKVLLREGMRLVPIESLRIGDAIWGYERWTTVQNVWDRGTKKTWLIELNNGSTMRFSPEHKVYVAFCQHHRKGTLLEKKCSCPISERKIERVTLDELRVHDVVISPEKIDYGSQDMDPRRAWIEGLYISDGNCKRSQFEIAGRDGFPREQQKRDVQAICEQFGIETKWAFNYVAVKDPDWTARMKAMGTYPWNKKALSLDLTAPAAREMLRGILADSGRNTNGRGRTFTTSSKDLLLQTRVLLKMIGASCSERFIQDHGSTSDYPIWRLGIRECQALTDLGTIYDKDRKKPPEIQGPYAKTKLLRVKTILRDEKEVECFDVATDDHYVWLPEADWTVSNCDDSSTFIAGCDLSIGRGCRLAAYMLDEEKARAGEYSHVLCEMGIRTPRGVEWLGQDTVAKKGFAWRPPQNEWFGEPNYLVIASP